MRTSFRLAAVTLVFAVGLSLGGCAPDAPAPKPTASPSATPLFATDEEALAAAEEAYAAYQAMSDAILMDGGKAPERLLEVATEEQYEAEKAGIDDIAASGYRSIGATKFDSMTIQMRAERPAPDDPIVTVYVCDNYADVDVVDASGNSVVAPDRPDRFPRVVAFGANMDPQERLVVASIDEWTGKAFC